MTHYQDELDELVRERLDRLVATSPRDEEKAARLRAAYLSQVKGLIEEGLPATTVSETPRQRLNGWISKLLPLPVRKERFSMLTTVTAILTVFALLFGGAGATAYAAQDSLPNDFLYPVKTFTEDVQLNLTADPQNQLDLLMSFANRRIDEVILLSTASEPIPAKVADRLQKNLIDMLVVASELEDPEMTEALTEIGVQIRKRDRDMINAQANIPEGVEPVMARVRAMMWLHIGLSETGLEDPNAFRLHMRQAQITPEPTPIVSETAEVLLPEDGLTDEGACDLCTPVYDGTGPGPGPGPGPANQGATTQPDDGYGPYGPMGTPACETCTPVYDGTGPGPGPNYRPQQTPSPSGGNSSGGNGTGKP